MARFNYDMIVIGGGAAGLTASTACGSVGMKTLLIEKEEKLGGDCLHYGCVPSKSLIKSAFVNHVIRDSEKYGLPKVEAPGVDYAQVSRRIRNIIASIQKHDEPDVIKDKYNVETQFGEAKFLNSHTIELNGRKVTSQNFVIATGSSPAVPPIEGIHDTPYITNIDIFSLKKLPESMIVLGGGPIGMEMSQAFARLGTKVTTVEFSSHVLPREDGDVSEFVEGFLEKEGVTILCNTKAVKAEHGDGMFVLTVEGNGKKETLQAEQLLVSTGRSPNVDGLELEKAGVQYDKKGIETDKNLKTNIKHIYACGDVNGRYPFTHVAAYEAGIAMMNAKFPFLSPFVKADYTYAPWCTYLDPEIASVGYNETRAKEAGIEYTVHKEDIGGNDRAKAEGETEGFIKVVINKKGVPIGCQIAAHHAGDLIHEWVAIINGKVSLSTVGNAIHAYPTLSEVNKMASLNYFLSASNLQKLRMFLNWRW